MSTHWSIKRDPLLNLRYRVNAMDISSNMKHIALTQGTKVCFYNPRLRKYIFSIFYHYKSTTSIRFSPNAQILAQGIKMSLDEERNYILIWNLRTRKQIGKFVINQIEVHDLDFSKDGQNIITESYRYVITKWNWTLRKRILIICDLMIKNFTTMYNPLEQDIVAISSKSEIQIVNIACKLIIKTLQSYNIAEMKYSLDGKFLAACQCFPTWIRGIRIWKSHSNNPTCANIIIQKLHVNKLLFSLNSALIIQATSDYSLSSISIISVKCKKIVRIFVQEPYNFVNNLLMSSDGQYFISTGNKLKITPFIQSN